MSANIHTLSFSPDWMSLSNKLSQLDRFDASWTAIEKREGQTLKQLKSIATVLSVGASTRIEGSKMTDDEVRVLIDKIKTTLLADRDQQEVAGYYAALELITASYKEIEITESSIKSLHNTMLRHSQKDAWHRGDYKQHPNEVEANNPSGSKQVIFRTTPPGYPTRNAMEALINWYRQDQKTIALLKDAIFVYEFLSIHPFQDGNGRLSRLLATLLLLKHRYTWIQYVSFEHEIERRKSEYYRVLMQCQRDRPGEEVRDWVEFFIDCLINIQDHLTAKLDVHKKTEKVTPREKAIYAFIENHPGSKSGEISRKLDIPLPTVKRILTEMVGAKQLSVAGNGAATNYSIEGSATILKDQVMEFSNEQMQRSITLKNQTSFLDIKKVILRPKFEWKHPDDWGTVLSRNGITIMVTCINAGALTTVQKPIIYLMPGPYQDKPVFEFDRDYNIPVDVWEGFPIKKEYPMQVMIDIKSQVDQIDFDIMIIYDEG